MVYFSRTRMCDADKLNVWFAVTVSRQSARFFFTLNGLAYQVLVTNGRQIKQVPKKLDNFDNFKSVHSSEEMPICGNVFSFLLFCFSHLGENESLLSIFVGQNPSWNKNCHVSSYFFPPSPNKLQWMKSQMWFWWGLAVDWGKTYRRRTLIKYYNNNN